MKYIVVAGVMLFGAVPAMAKCNNGGGSDGGYRTSAQITALLNPGTGVYACYNNGSARENNETLVNATQVQDYKLGANPKDPASVVGSYTIGTDSNGGVITYNYGSYTASYNICGNPTVTGPGIFKFSPTAGGSNLSIIVSSGPGTC